jgi:hypothetical protein
MDFFPILLLNARPAAGKSEIVRFLQQVELAERVARYHVGAMHILDDFPMIWTWFEEDELLESVFGRPRLHSTPEGYFLHEDFWHLLICRLSREYGRWRRDAIGEETAIIEFSRGIPGDGYRGAYRYLSETILGQAACLYIKVSFAESLRKNRLRYNPQRPDTILEHALPDAKMERLYRRDDWEEFTSGDPTHIHVGAHRIPYVVFENEDDLTTAGGEPLGAPLEEALSRLWRLWKGDR